MEKKTAKDVGGIGNADGKCALHFDVLHGFVGFGEVQNNGVSLLHGGPMRRSSHSRCRPRYKSQPSEPA